MDKWKVSGFVGLAPDADDTGMLSLIKQIKENEQSEVKPVFSFFLSDSSLYDGKLMIGGYDEDKYALPGHKMFWAPMAT